MKQVRRSKHLATTSSSSSSSSNNSSSPFKRVSNGFDVFEFDEYDDDTSTNDPTKWNLMESRNKTRYQIQDDDDDESDLPLSALRKKFRSDKPKGKNDVSHHHQKLAKPTLVHNKRLHTDAVYDQQNKKSHSKRKLVAPIKGKESQVKHGIATEKQLLREKIKNMLLAADWTIDYRPRRNRDYLDSVYISPVTGTGYWSIVKAYDAFQKEEEHNSNDATNFTPLPEEILGTLTRQTQKKIEREMINKRKSDNNEENHGRKSRKIHRCTLLVRGSDNSENDSFVAYSGKRTLLSWLLESGVVRTSEHVEYMTRRKTRIMQKGWITKDGIRCGCCSKVVTALNFERHAGSKLGQPFQNMVLESGKSLMQCQIDAWNKQGELERKGFYSVDVDGDDPNDDTCGICGDGGDLICCDGCPSTFHQTCLNIQMLPQGDWHCPNCSCKYCELAGRDCTEVGGETEDPFLICCLCQKKYHESCRPEVDVKPIESSYPNLSFCEHKCHELYSHLQKLVGVKHELDSGFSWSLIHRSDLLKDVSSVPLSQQVECNSMLAVAMSVMDECFQPFTDRRSGTNLIRNVVFNCGSNLSRLNYSGFFTAILEKEDEVICAASIRVHGMQLAEMPFIGTRHIYRRQGMCRRLLSAVESALSSLQVEKLVIPAVAEHMHTWTDIFGFHPLEESHKQELKSMNMVVFPGTDMLQKPLVKLDNPPNAIPKDKNTAEIDDYRALSEKSELISSDEKDYSDKTATRDSVSQEPSVPLDDASKETPSVSSPVKDEDITNRSEMVSSVKTAEANSHPAQVLDISCKPKPSVSVEEESSLQEQVGYRWAIPKPLKSLLLIYVIPFLQLFIGNSQERNIFPTIHIPTPI